MKNIPECQRTITTRSLKDYSYHQNYYNLICIDWSRQTNTTNSQQINFTEKLEEDGGVRMFVFIAEKQQKFILNFSLDSLSVTK